MKLLAMIPMVLTLLAGCGGGSSSGTSGNDIQSRDSVAATAATVIVVNH